MVVLKTGRKKPLLMLPKKIRSRCEFLERARDKALGATPTGEEGRNGAADAAHDHAAEQEQTRTKKARVKELSSDIIKAETGMAPQDGSIAVDMWRTEMAKLERELEVEEHYLAGISHLLEALEVKRIYVGGTGSEANLRRKEEALEGPALHRKEEQVGTRIAQSMVGLGDRKEEDVAARTAGGRGSA